MYKSKRVGNLSRLSALKLQKVKVDLAVIKSTKNQVTEYLLTPLGR